MNFRTILAASLATAAGLSAVGEEVAWTDSTSLTITQAVTNTFDQAFDKSTGYLQVYQQAAGGGLAADTQPVVFKLADGADAGSGLSLNRFYVGPKDTNVASGWLQILGGYYKASAYGFISGNSGGEGVLDLLGGAVEFADVAQIASSKEHKGTLNISGGEMKSTSTGRDFVVANGPSSTGIVYMTSGKFSSARAITLALGDASIASFTMTGGETSATTDFSVGAGSAATATAEISGGTLTVGANTYVANKDSKGDLNVSGGTLNLQGLRVGAGGSSVGSMEVSGGTVTVSDSSGHVGVGYGENSKGYLTLSGTGKISIPNKDLELAANNATAYGEVLVLGGEMDIPKSLKVAMTKSSSSKMTISNGTVTVANDFNIAHGESTSATGEIAGGTVNTKTLTVANAVSSEGSLTISGGTLTASSDMNVANGASSTATGLISGGTVSASTIYVGKGSASLGSLKVTDGAITTSWCLNVGRYANATGKVEITGGTFTCDRGVEFGNDQNAVAEVKVSGGKLSEGSNRFWLASGKSSKVNVEVSGDGVLEALKAPIMFYKADDSEAVLTLQTGSTLVLSQITTNGVVGTGTANVVLDGGLLQPSTETRYLNADKWLDASDCISYQIAAGGVTIDTDSKDLTIPAVLSSALAAGTVDGGLVKEGEGTLTLSAQPTYTGITEVKAGTLNLAEGVTLPGGIRDGKGKITFVGSTFPGKLTIPSGEEFVYDDTITYPGITLEEGATMVIKVSNYTSGMTVTLPTVTVPTGSKLEDMVIINVGHRATITVDTSSGTPIATITDVDDPTAAMTTRWTNASGDGYWHTAGNWTFGVPATNDTAVIESDATIYEDGDSAVTNVVADLKILNGCTFTYCSSTPDAKKPLLAPKSIEGNGTLKLHRAALMTVDSPLTVPNTIDIEIQAEKVNRRGEIMAESDANAITINGRVIAPDAGEGNNQFRLYRCVINGELVVNSYNSFANRFSKDYSSRLESCKIYGKVSGTGDFSYVTCQLGGDWAEFYGAAGQRETAGKSNRFIGPFDGSHAYWGLGTNTKLDTAKGNVFKFGTVTNVMTGAVITPHKDKETIMEVGERDEDCYLIDNFACHEGGETAGTLPKFTIRKVGTGTLYTDTYGVANWAVTNGTIAFSAIAEGTTLSDIPDKAISSITVSGTGKVTGELNSSAVTTIGSLVYDGTQFGLTATAGDNGAVTAEVANPIWTSDLIAATKLQNGCAFVCDPDSINVLKNVAVGTTIDNVMTGTNLSGAIDELVVTRRADGKKDLVWQSIVNAANVTLKLVKKGQFFLIIR